MNRSNGESPHTLEELVARTLFQDQHRHRSWDRSKGFLQANARKRAREAMNRCGIKNIEVDMVITDPKEGAR